MSKPELTLSNTTTFFSGKIENLFRKAKLHGFKYVEIIPYRWNTPGQLMDLEKKYQIEIVGIHLPIWWNRSVWQEAARQGSLFEKLFAFVWRFYLGCAQNSPALQIVEALAPPYLAVHANVMDEMGAKTFQKISKKINVVVENLPYKTTMPEFYWNPGKTGAKTLFDIGHFIQNKLPKGSPALIDAYRQAKPEVVHISYNSRGIHHLPDSREQAVLANLLRIHQPKYITLETNPLVSVRKGKKMLEGITAKFRC